MSTLWIWEAILRFGKCTSIDTNFGEEITTRSRRFYDGRESMLPLIAELAVRTRCLSEVAVERVEAYRMEKQYALTQLCKAVARMMQHERVIGNMRCCTGCAE